MSREQSAVNRDHMSGLAGFAKETAHDAGNPLIPDEYDKTFGLSIGERAEAGRLVLWNVG